MNNVVIENGKYVIANCGKWSIAIDNIKDWNSDTITQLKKKPLDNRSKFVLSNSNGLFNYEFSNVRTLDSVNSIDLITSFVNELNKDKEFIEYANTIYSTRYSKNVRYFNRQFDGFKVYLRYDGTTDDKLPVGETASLIAVDNDLGLKIKIADYHYTSDKPSRIGNLTVFLTNVAGSDVSSVISRFFRNEETYTAIAEAVDHAEKRDLEVARFAEEQRLSAAVEEPEVIDFVKPEPIEQQVVHTTKKRGRQPSN